ncbi:hypothetical protein V5O48_009131, partial [Marasmius crinis-equi]
MEPIGCWEYILAQTEQKDRPIYVRVPVGKTVPYWPHMHSSHLLLLAEIAPSVTGLSSAGLENIQKAADRCYRPPISEYPGSSIKKMLPGDEDAAAATVSRSWPGYPVLAERRQLGDWMLKHLAPADLPGLPVIAPTIPVPDHWCEPSSEPPADDFKFLTLDPAESLRDRDLAHQYGGQSFSSHSHTSARYPCVSVTHDHLSKLGTNFVSHPSPDSSCSSE